MKNGHRGLTVKWLAGICGMLFVGGGNVVGVMVQRLAYEGGAAWETAALMRWLASGGLWGIGGVLTAVIYALRCAVEEHVQSTVIRVFAVILLPALVSCIGFSQIVDRFYAPAGLLCLFVVFYPLFRRRKAWHSAQISLRYQTQKKGDSGYGL